MNFRSSFFTEKERKDSTDETVTISVSLLKEKVEDKKTNKPPELLLRAYFQQLSNMSHFHLKKEIGERIFEICLTHEKAAAELLVINMKRQRFFLSILSKSPIKLKKFVEKYPYVLEDLVACADCSFLIGIEEKIKKAKEKFLSNSLSGILNDIEEEFDFKTIGKPLPTFKGAHQYGKGALAEGRRCPQGAIQIYQEFFYRKGSAKPKTEEIAIKIIRTAAHELNHRQWPFSQNEATNIFYQKTINALVYADEKNISLLKTAIEKHNFNLSFPYGKSVTLANGKTVRLPHRVAKIYALLVGLKKENKADKIVALTRQVAKLAAEALDRASFFGQSEGATVFYESILENLVTCRPLAGILISKIRPRLKKFKAPSDLNNEILQYPESYTIHSTAAFNRLLKETNAIEIINSQFKLNDLKKLIMCNSNFVRHILTLNTISCFDSADHVYGLLKTTKMTNETTSVLVLLIEKAIKINLFKDHKKFIEIAKENWEVANLILQHMI